MVKFVDSKDSPSRFTYFLIARVNNYKNQINVLTLNISRLSSEISKLTVQISQANNSIDECISIQKVYTNKISELETEISNLNSRLEILYGNVTVEQAKELIETVDSLVILDVRTVQEFEEDHIEGAVNIPVDELQERWEEVKFRAHISNQTLVYCKSGVRSSRGIKILEDHGLSNTYNMIGGFDSWKKAGYPVNCQTCG
jgi:rhodanese-related sulfurtransferase